jgi:IS1 family transposase
LEVWEVWEVSAASSGSCGRTWTAIDADTKLIPSFHVGSRDAVDANIFIRDLAGRLDHRVQLTTDGHKSYLDAVERAFGDGIDYAMLVKHYGPAPEGPQRRYSPAECTGTTVGVVTGRPDMKHVSTSYVERSNLSMRMGIRRFTRLTNAFSKKVENHWYALAIYFMHYNYVRIHTTLRTSPAMAAGVSKTLWSMDDVVKVVEEWEAAQ